MSKTNTNKNKKRKKKIAHVILITCYLLPYSTSELFHNNNCHVDAMMKGCTKWFWQAGLQCPMLWLLRKAFVAEHWVQMYEYEQGTRGCATLITDNILNWSLLMFNCYSHWVPYLSKAWCLVPGDDNWGYMTLEHCHCLCCNIGTEKERN
jgi:hypothetical protein